MSRNLADVNSVAGTFAALADANRVQLLWELRDGRELCVDELAKKLKLRQPTVSHHLGILRLHRFVTSRREGKRVFYSLNPKALEKAGTFFSIISHPRRQARKPTRR